MRDSESLFFVHDNQTEIAKADVFREHSVRADHDVDFTGFDALDYVLLFFG